MIFGAKAKKAAAYEKLRQVETAYAELEKRNRELVAAAEAMKQRAFLFGIEREGKLNKFMFVRNGQLFTIETYGTLGDDVPGWKRELLE